MNPETTTPAPKVGTSALFAFRITGKFRHGCQWESWQIWESEADAKAEMNKWEREHPTPCDWMKVVKVEVSAICLNCKQEMRFNVPRLGVAGGFVHAHSGRFECKANVHRELPPPTMSENTTESYGG